MDMLEIAKDLIKKGNELNDSELVTMGYQMLEKYSTESELCDTIKEIYGETKFQIVKTMPNDSTIPEPSVNDDLIHIDTEKVPPQKMYVCDHCSSTFAYDKENRKACPNCKKRGLHTVFGWFGDPVDKDPPPTKVSVENFQTQIRKNEVTRIRYTEDGVPDGVYSKSEPVENIKNMWQDDGLEKNDPANERLKAFTKISPRTRKPVKMVTVTCDVCKKSEKIHPLHVGGRARFVCNKCLRKGVRV